MSTNHSPSRLLTPGRVSSRGRRVLSFAPLALFLVVGMTGCATGYVTTSSEAIVPAATVQAQDITGDALLVLQDVHNAAVRAHDAKVDSEPADVHAKRRAALKASASGLRGAWDGLAAWKLGSEGAGMAAVVGKVRDALPELLDAAVALGIVSREYADAIGVFFGTASQGLVPRPLAKQPVASILAPADGIDWRAAVQPLHREAYFDECNWHRPLPFGGELVTSMGCGYSAVTLVNSPLKSTAENKVTVIDGKLVAITDGRPE